MSLAISLKAEPGEMVIVDKHELKLQRAMYYSGLEHRLWGLPEIESQL